RHSYRQRERHAKGSGAGKKREGVEAQIVITPAVDPQRTVELLRLLVHRPELFRAQMSFETVGGKISSYHAEVVDRPPELDYSRGDILHWNPRHRLEAQTAL